MKTNVKNLFLLPSFIAFFSLMFCAPMEAQTFCTLHAFSSGTSIVRVGTANSDGALPIGGLILSGNTLYGATQTGGPNATGTVFAINTDGTGFITLHNFGEWPGTVPNMNSDGCRPTGGVVLSANTLYGTAQFGGAQCEGTVFAVNTDGTGFSTLHSFSTAILDTNTYGGDAEELNTNSDGYNPAAGVIVSGNTLYGTAEYGGLAGTGTVFAVNTDGTGFRTLHSFGPIYWNGDLGSPLSTNTDGAYPTGALVLSGNRLYGASGGGPFAYGTIFAVNTDGTDFTILWECDGGDLVGPTAPLLLYGNTIYGAGGGGSYGTVFAINTDGTGFTCQPLSGSNGPTGPLGLMLSGRTLYGTTPATVFAINTNWSDCTTLYTFTNSFDGDSPQPKCGLILSGTTLYGTTWYGGTSGNGTVFSLSFPSPQINITCSATSLSTNVNLTWSTVLDGFYGGLTLQSTRNLKPPVVWSPVSQAPVLNNIWARCMSNGLCIVTNCITGPQQFYQLSQ